MKENKLFRYLFSREFASQLKIALSIFFGILLLTEICLWFFTRHSNGNPVPDFKGLTLQQSKELAKDEGLRIHVMDSVYNQLRMPGTVVEQEPKPGFEVKKNRRIFIVVNAWNPEKIKMPNIVGVSLRQAIAILESNGLSVGKLRYVPDIATNNVLKQRLNGKDINAGLEVIKGSHIDLVLGKSDSNAPAQLPELIGFTLREAEKQIAQAYFNKGATIFDKTIKNSIDSTNAIVYKQKPDIGKRQSAPMGSLIDIWLTLDNDKVKIKSSSKNE
jgi:eukaryotic-like serine/threonine-protein kinase